MNKLEYRLMENFLNELKNDNNKQKTKKKQYLKNVFK